MARPPQPELPAWKKLAFSAPALVLFFGLAELALYLAGVPAVLEREDPFRGFSGLVSVFERRGDVYTSDRPANAETFNTQTFLAEKPANGLRVFCVGGSSAYGFPWGAEAAFCAILGDLLRAAHPELAIEAVNAAGISYASHRLRILVRELLRYDPDLLVVYGGHNEFVEKRFHRSLRARAETLGRLQHLLHRSRVHGALHALLARPRRGPPGAAAGDLPGIRVQRDFAEPLDPVERAELEAFFAENLGAIARMAAARGVRVVLCTVAPNLRDWKPQRAPSWPLLPEGARREWEAHVAAAAAALDADAPAAAAARLEAAVAIAPRDGPSWFLLGRAYEGLERPDEARRAYLRALEFDLDPSRATEGINRAIRAVAAREGALLVDIEERFARLSPHGIVGFEWIEDYVHPTREGHEEIAFAVWQALRGAGLPAAASSAHRQDDLRLFSEIVRARRALPVASEHTPTYLYNQGMVLANQGRWEEARARFEAGLELRPG